MDNVQFALADATRLVGEHKQELTKRMNRRAMANMEALICKLESEMYGALRSRQIGL